MYEDLTIISTKFLKFWALSLSIIKWCQKKREKQSIKSRACIFKVKKQIHDMLSSPEYLRNKWSEIS
jgi:hypothetical protein